MLQLYINTLLLCKGANLDLHGSVVVMPSLNSVHGRSAATRLRAIVLGNSPRPLEPGPGGVPPLRFLLPAVSLFLRQFPPHGLDDFVHAAFWKIGSTRLGRSSFWS